jgi:hypothetical protein
MWGFGAQRARFLIGSRRPKLSSFEVGESESMEEIFNILTLSGEQACLQRRDLFRRNRDRWGCFVNIGGDIVWRASRWALRAW